MTTCEEIQSQLPLYCYGEITSESEELVESHLEGCADCRAQLQRHRNFLDVLDRRPDGGDSALLAGCRAELRAALATRRKSFWEWQIPFRIPVGAMALVALGFFGARIVPEQYQPLRSQAMFSSVSSVEPDATSGQVRIAVDEIRRHVVSGLAQDPAIQTLLLNAVREETNPGVRVTSIGVLQANADSAKVRQALVDALMRDPNAGVRLKALEGLKPYAGDALVRRTLADVLLRDDTPAVRIQAIDLLTAHHDDSIVGTLQNAVRKEDNTYVRTHCGRLLEEMKASVGTY